MNYKRGSTGPEVKKIQERLRVLGFYLGAIDGGFGQGTEAAVKKFQTAKGIKSDGEVGPTTWKLLFEIPVAKQPLPDRPLPVRCLALTGSFETSLPPPDCFAGLSGNFDGMGISFGVLQWNLGQGSLQPLIQEMDNKHRSILKGAFSANYAELIQSVKLPKSEGVAWSKTIQSNKFVVNEPWRSQFKTLGRTNEYQAIQTDHADANFRKALDWCKDYGLWSQRAVALMFDIRTQNGSIKPATKDLIMADFAALPAMPEAEREVARMRIVANRRAEASNPVWIEDVRKRKLTIANGTGTVHGQQYDLATTYGILLRKF
ncbi:MAG: peptidoglycan-binding domain-containing protein [Fimbriimonadaceae bacterium]